MLFLTTSLRKEVDQNVKLNEIQLTKLWYSMDGESNVLLNALGIKYNSHRQ